MPIESADDALEKTYTFAGRNKIPAGQKAIETVSLQKHSIAYAISVQNIVVCSVLS